MRYILYLLFFTAISLSTYSQTGKVEGKITDSKTGKTLSGVSVTVVGNSKGVATDIDGHFILVLAASKPQIIRVSSVGYQTKEIENVEIAPNALSNLDIVLETATKTEVEIVIRTTRREETTAALIAYQKNTNTVAQVVSAESIRRSPDKNTSEVLKRIPGTSIQEGKYIIVRGLNDRYNATMLNGILLGTTEPDRKTFSFDIFPAGMIDNIIINKAFVPELPGEWAGGLVQVNTKDVPAKNYLNIVVGTGFNTQTIGKDYYSYKGGKIDWLGMDDGFRAIPDALPVKSKYNVMDPSGKTELGKLFKNIWSADKNSSTFFPVLNKNVQLSGGFNKKLGEKSKLGAVFAINYNQSNKRTDYINNRLFGVQNNLPFITYDYSDKKYSQDILWGGLANVTLQLGSNNKISFKNIINVNSTNYVTARTGKDFDFNSFDGENIRATELALKTNTFFNTSISGDHNLVKYKAKLHWYGSFNILDQYIPDQRRIQYDQDPGDASNPYFLLIGPSKTSQKSGSRYYGFLNDYNYTAGGDLSKSFKLFNQDQSVKGGYLFQVKDRLFDSRPFSVYLPTDNKALTQLPADKVFSPENFGNGTDNKFAFNEIAGDQYRYIANTILNAGFLQLDNQFTDRLRATYGVRFEDYDQVIGSLKQSDRRFLHTEVLDFLPGVNITYKLNGKTNLRLSGSQTVIRPEFRELSDFAFYDFDLGATITGNKALERTKVSNADIRYEIYPRAGELFTVGAFYKYFKSPIELFFNQSGTGGSSTFNYINADNAYSFGGELEFRKKLYFAEALKNFTFQTNLSYIYNRVKKGSANLDRPMQGQSPYVINAALQYDIEKCGINTTLLFNQIGDRIYYVGGNDIAPVTEQHRSLLDFQIAKKVLKNTGEIKLNISDILNHADNFYLDVNNNRKYDGTDLLVIKRKYGSNFNISFSYNLK
ncbi:MAG TPA: TonB-dependent receptor [Chitinophagaceae bacterium]|nr:TonB-dependent receptor [Chitinophagaceae bacterium]